MNAPIVEIRMQTLIISPTLIVSPTLILSLTLWLQMPSKPLRWMPLILLQLTHLTTTTSYHPLAGLDLAQAVTTQISRFLKLLSEALLVLARPFPFILFVNTFNLNKTSVDV